MNTFLTSSKKSYKLARTIVQALIGFAVDWIAQIIALTPLSGEVQAIIVALTIAVLTPVMAALGEKTRGDENVE